MRTLLLILLSFHQYGTCLSEYAVEHIQDGVRYELSVDCIACNADEPISVRYSTQNLGHPLIRLLFSSGKTSDITITMGDSSYNTSDGGRFTQALWETGLETGSRFAVSTLVNGTMGDTIEVLAKPVAYGFKVPVGPFGFQDLLNLNGNLSQDDPGFDPDPLYDQDGDGRVTFGDVIELLGNGVSMLFGIPEGATLITSIVIRPRSADLNGDALVDLDDFLAFTGIFGSQAGSGEYDPNADLDGNGRIGFEDFILFSELFSDAN